MQMISNSASGLGALGGGIIGQQAAGPDRGAAQGLIDTGTNAWIGLQTPQDLANPLNFQNYSSAGQLTPEQQQYMLAAPSLAAGVIGNPNLVNAQMQALNAMKGASQTGMTSADRARLNQIQQQMATQQEGARQQIMQNYAQRGQAGSGNQLLAELNASQNAAQNANQNSLQAAGQAQTNALNALSQYGGMAGQMNTQQFGQQTQAAQAADALNRFNVQNQIQQQAANVAAQNAAKQFNLQNQQGIMNANTGLANQNQIMQRAGEQQMFADQAQRAGGLSGAAMQGAGAYNNMANSIAKGWQNIGQGAGQFLGGAASGSGGGGGGGGGGMSSSPSGFGDIAGGAGDNMGSMGGELMGDATAFVAYGGEIGNPRQEIPNLAYGGPITMPMNEIPNLAMGGECYSNGGVSGVSTTSRNTYPAYSIGGLYSSPITMVEGGHVPGKEVVPGDSLKNDVVSARLSSGEIVLPKSVTQSENPLFDSMQFVQKILNSKKK